MNIKFRKIEIHNFLSYQDEVFEFTKTNGMNLITGKNHDVPGSKNGAGKSGWALALTYGLYGELPFSLNKENIPNRFLKGKDNETRVCIYLDSDRKHYKICSGIKKNASNCSLYEVVNGKEKDITKSTISETRDYIIKEILNCDIDLFMRTIFLNSDPSYNFYNLSKKDKKDFIDKLFDISVYSEMYKSVHSAVTAREKELARCQNTLAVLNKNSEDFNERKEKFTEERDTELKTLNERLTESKSLLSSKMENSVERNTDAINEYMKKNTELSDKLTSLRMDMQKIEFSTRTLKNTIDNCKSKISDREKFISKHNTLKTKLCDDCKNVFTKHYNLDVYTKDINKLQKEIEKCNNNILTNESTFKELKESKFRIETEKRDVSDKIVELNSGYNSYRNEISRIESDINSLNAKIETLSNSKNPYISMIESNDRSIKDTEMEYEKIRHEYEVNKFFQGIVEQDNIKKYITKNLVGVLNSRVRHYLHLLGANYDIIFDENMDYVFNTQDVTGAQFHNFSSGEQARISISTCFAFRDFLSIRSSIVSNILILDEFIDSNVDSQAIENVVEILKDFSRVNKQNIYLVSHRQEVGTENFDRIIQIEKKNNISSIKYIKT